MGYISTKTDEVPYVRTCLTKPGGARVRVQGREGIVYRSSEPPFEGEQYWVLYDGGGVACHPISKYEVEDA